MSETHRAILEKELGISDRQVQAVMGLLDEGATVPFIARYRKEATGGLDEVVIITLRDRLEQLRDLDKRREAILASLEEQDKLTDELKAAVESAPTMAKLEDIYLPYRPKRRTRGMIAREKGLEPLAELIKAQGGHDLKVAAEAYIDLEKEVANVEEALAGARDIIAEEINEDPQVREAMRTIFSRKAAMSSKVVKSKAETQEAAKYRDYFEWDEPAKDAPSHRILAVRRGAEEGFLTYHVLPEEEEALRFLAKRYVTGKGFAAEQMELAAEDAYKRLLSLSMETEMRTELKKRADDEAIGVFASNLRELLLASPMGRKATIGVDPGLRTGCKVVALDPQGALLETATIYPLVPHRKVDEAAAVLKRLASKYGIEAVAVGNGTGGREALDFCKSIPFERPLIISMVNESGASVYSASAVAREEFPDQDLTVRGAVSIGRRLMDPLAELVKIDPKSIGVGQYQHDVDQRNLKKSLDDVVMSCVNAVGVEANTASKELLSYVSGLSPRLAKSFVEHRNSHGAFSSREDFLRVPGMGPKTFEQAAGFLRIREAKNRLDSSAVHPERYGIVERMARDLGTDVATLMDDPGVRQHIDLKKYVGDDVGLPTLEDIIAELAKPGRDPREEFELFSFTEGVNEPKDLTVGMKLPGVVTNVTAFGAFVDVGVHQDGLVHISQLADRFVDDPATVVKVNQKVDVTVVSVDLARNRIGLSMKTNPDFPDSSEGASTGGGRRREGGGSRPRADRPKTPRGTSKPKPKSKYDEYPEDNPFVKFMRDKEKGGR